MNVRRTVVVTVVVQLALVTNMISLTDFLCVLFLTTPPAHLTRYVLVDDFHTKPSESWLVLDVVCQRVLRHRVQSTAHFQPPCPNLDAFEIRSDDESIPL